MFRGSDVSSKFFSGIWGSQSRVNLGKCTKDRYGILLRSRVYVFVPKLQVVEVMKHHRSINLIVG